MLKFYATEATECVDMKHDSTMWQRKNIVANAIITRADHAVVTITHTVA
jgi:hypothetical protein